jgi:phosphoadenosine phosphosulfate reductase
MASVVPSSKPATKREPPSQEQISRWADDLDDADPQAIIRFAVDTFGAPNIAVATQFGVEGCTLLHRVAVVAQDAWFFTIDTGVLFEETYRLADELEKRLGITINRVRPAQTIGEQAVTYGPNLWESDPDLCCTLRKVQPMQEALYGFAAWMTAVRREQSSTRKQTRVVDWDPKFELVKIAPLAGQSAEAIARYVAENEVPTNPLRLIGYPSLGCFPCTRPVKPGEDARAGRWAKFEKTECGLHTKK